LPAETVEDTVTARFQARIRGLVWTIRGLPSRAVSGVRRHGLAGATREVLRLLRALPSQRRAQRRVRAFDRQYGVETAGIVRLGGLRIESANRSRGVRYQPTDPDDFHELIAALPIEHDRYTFVDVGSGKGRVLLLASELPFPRVVGVEFSEELNEIARDNVRRVSDTLGRSLPIEIVTTDAAAYVFPSTPLVVYFYNPFDTHVLSRVLTNLGRAVSGLTLPSYLVYTGSVPVAALIEQQGFKRVPSPGSSESRGIFQTSSTA
jgi:SAM-dependent methyltransferase